MWALYSRASRCRCVVKGISVWARGAGEAGSLPASRNAAAGLKKQEAPAVRMHQVDVNWQPRFLPLVELLPLPLPPFLPLSLFFFFKNKCHIPAISYLLCWQPQWPVEDSPLQPVHSRRRPVYTALIGSAPDCPCDLSPALTPPLFLSPLSFFSALLFSLGLSLLPPLRFLCPHNPPLPCSSEAPTVGRGAALLCGSPGSGDVNQSWF